MDDLDWIRDIVVTKYDVGDRIPSMNGVTYRDSDSNYNDLWSGPIQGWGHGIVISYDIDYYVIELFSSGGETPYVNHITVRKEDIDTL